MLSKLFKKDKKKKEQFNDENIMIIENNSDTGKYSKKDKKNKDKKEKTGRNLFNKNIVADAIKPQGINPNPLDYMVINNNVNVYTRTLYVKSIPKKSRFAYTFSNIFRYPNTNVAVYIEPIATGKAVSELNKDIITLDTERLEVIGKNRNRERTLSKKLAEAEGLADSIEAGDNQMFNLAIYITVYGKSLEELDKATVDFANAAKNTGITVSSCWQYHDKAFKVCTPNGKNNIGYWHPVDKDSLATLFHYTNSDFSHKKGSWLGTNLRTGRNVFYYLFDDSLNGYNAVVTGITGSGKSSIIKKMVTDHVEMGCKVIAMDVDSSTERGEYSLTAEAVNGIDIPINADSNIILSPFDINVELVYDKLTGREKKILDLKTKIGDVTQILLTMARGSGKTSVNFDDEMCRQLIQDIVTADYEDRKIYHNEPDSLYTAGKVIQNNKLTSGLVKKELPTITSWYEKFCIAADNNTNQSYSYQYDYLKLVMKDWVRGIGTRPYFDGQSNITFDTNIPFTNIDIHKLNETTEKPIAQIIIMSKIWEDYIKKNSENPKAAEQLIAIFDEAHLLLRYPEARALLVNMYKRIRKKNGGVITSTQEITEFNKYDDTRAIITNAETKIIGKQDENLVEDVQKILNLTDSEAYSTVTFDNKGQYLVKSKSRKVFIQSHLLDIERKAFETNRRIIDKLRKEEREKASVNAG